MTFLVAVIEEFPLSGFSLLRLGLKVVVFAVMGYATLFSPRGRNWLAGLLGRFKEEG